MLRLMHALAIAALIGSAVYVYGVKYRTIYASEQLVKAKHLVNKEKDAINLLRAQYAHLARPTGCRRSPTRSSACRRWP